MTELLWTETGTPQSQAVAQQVRQLIADSAWLSGYEDGHFVTVHFLKTEDPHFGHIRSGIKFQDTRVDDRGGYQRGHWLVLEQYSLDKETGIGTYSGQFELVLVSHILSSEQCPQALIPGAVVMSIMRVFSGQEQRAEVCA